MEFGKTKYFMFDDECEIDESKFSVLESELRGYSYGQACAINDAAQWFNKNPDLDEIFELYEKYYKLLEQLNIIRDSKTYDEYYKLLGELELEIQKVEEELDNKKTYIINDNIIKSNISSHLNNESSFSKKAIVGYKEMWNQYFYCAYLAKMKPEKLEERQEFYNRKYHEVFIPIESEEEIIEEEIELKK